MAASYQSCVGCCCFPSQGNLHAASSVDGKLTSYQKNYVEYFVMCKILQLAFLELGA